MYSQKSAHAPLSPEVERLAALIVDAAFAVHKNLGPGLLESIYEPCFCHEIAKRGAAYEKQVIIPLVYDGIKFSEGLRIDVLVEKNIICELKAVEMIKPVHSAASCRNQTELISPQRHKVHRESLCGHKEKPLCALCLCGEKICADDANVAR
jgi:GxxExxY protein